MVRQEQLQPRDIRLNSSLMNPLHAFVVRMPKKQKKPYGLLPTCTGQSFHIDGRRLLPQFSSGNLPRSQLTFHIGTLHHCSAIPSAYRISEDRWVRHKQAGRSSPDTSSLPCVRSRDVSELIVCTLNIRLFSCLECDMLLSV